MRHSTLTHRAALAPLLAACALGAGAGAANAESVVYTDVDNKIWAENVDGTFRRAITPDGDPQFPYSFPSMNDAGDVAAIRRNRVANLDTRIVYVAAGATTPIENVMPSWGSGVLTPLSARLQPEGRLLAYSFVRGDLWSNTQAGNVVPADAPGSPTAGPGFPGMLSSTWNAGKLVWSDGTSLAYGNGGESSSWLSASDRSFSFGEVSRDGNWLLARTRTTAGTTEIAYQAMRGPMPSTVNETVGGCYVPFTGTLGHIAISPSGQHVAFRDDAGLHVAKVTLPPGTEATCQLQDRIVSATASDPSFSNYTAVDPNQRPPESRPPVEDRRPVDERRPGDDGRRAPVGRRGRVAVPARSLRAALAKGLTVKLSGLPKGRLTVRAKQGRKVVASGRATVAASGKATVKLRFTAAARRALKRKRSVALTIVAGKATAKVTLKR